MSREGASFSYLHPFKAKSCFLLCLLRRVLTCLPWGRVLLFHFGFGFCLALFACLVFVLCGFAMLFLGGDFSRMPCPALHSAQAQWGGTLTGKSLTTVSSSFLLMRTFITTPYISSFILECLSHVPGHILNFSFKPDSSLSPVAPPCLPDGSIISYISR